MRFLSELIRPSIFTGILAVFTGLVGFYITNVVESLRSGYTAVYYFEPDASAETVVFHLVNVSRTKRIDAASFVIKCADQSKDCFGMIPGVSPPSPVSEVTTPPNFGRQIDGGGSGPATVRVCLGAIASSRTSVRVAPTGGKVTPLMALYDPWSSDCAPDIKEATNLLLLGRRDPHAFLVRHYFTVITVALAVSAAILAVTGLGIIVRGIWKKKEVPDEAPGV
ncbi:hypothetical protein FA743_18025 [Paracoccus gahaiensis]|uniref:Uncharacterized protein n=1 Tax=Paracoccus gahaiensis TaxID=1706839 RepID=A0A4U0R4V5_9RHOB|nr:hypothetical protein [Paracoccus gahaiensis]TJZ89706.1 hypothetical protein FA743_18025 [Paracoccus gahaiensis]